MSLSLNMIEDAAERLAGVAQRTPLLEAPLLNEELGARVLFKPECLQVTGSFKLRGAYTKLSRLHPDVRQNGVVAFSSGNHAQGVAYAARAFGVRATIIMPSDAPQMKIDNTRAYGAEVILYDRFGESREEIGACVSEETGATLVKPYDDFDIISGQGTVGLEVAEQTAALNVTADALICPAGGGGLMAGLSTAMKARSPETRLYCAEPERFDDTCRSLAADTILSNEPGPMSICDAIVTPAPGQLTFPINRSTLSGGFSVSDHDVVAAMRLLFERLKLVAEPGATVSLAALMKNREQFSGQTVVIVLSGGNVDLQTFLSLCQDGVPVASAA
ncbi:threonine ammonia-lyase [Coralliovum pocilloporae]|uniref:threonine ammonia-lyase n=1 Tax=Coralliovum pocilloporae TaxID=3066369 RepID=UPI0033079FF1